MRHSTNHLQVSKHASGRKIGGHLPFQQPEVDRCDQRFACGCPIFIKLLGPGREAARLPSSIPAAKVTGWNVQAGQRPEMKPVCAIILLLQLNVVVSMVWSGGVTSSRAALVVDGVEAGGDIVVSKEKSLATPVRTITVTSNETYMGVAYVEVSGLESMTKYYYGSGQHVGSFTTFPVEGTATSFVAGVSSCAFTGYEHPVFTEIEDQNLAFFAHIGDFHYEDLESNDVGARLQAFRDVFKSKQQVSMIDTVDLKHINVL